MDKGFVRMTSRQWSFTVVLLFIPAGS